MGKSFQWKIWVSFIKSLACFNHLFLSGFYFTHIQFDTKTIASSNQPAPDSSIAMDDVNDLGAILAVGFAWKVTKADIIAFFADVDIIGGNDGIQIRKNGAMEAVFFVYTKVDVQNALAHDKRSDGSRRIHGMHSYLLFW